jgi:asparagine synthase (glutamine-hydrolysing)
MGAILFAIYTQKSPLSIEFTQAFMTMFSRGSDDTQYITTATTAITKFNEDQIKLRLSKREMAEYQQMYFLLGYHRNAINDLSIDATQPFEDPIQHKILDNPELRLRPKRRLMCDGEIYNFKELIQANNFGDKDLQSNSDVEVILPLYIQEGLSSTINLLDGEYSFVITDNIETYNLKQVNAFVVRDMFGTRPMFMVKGTDSNNPFRMFVSELKGVPSHILQSKDFVVQEMPPGTYWSFQNTSNDEFTSYIDWEEYTKIDTFCTINSTTPDALAVLYNQIQEEVQTAITSRMQTSDVPIGILLSGGFDSSIILSVMGKNAVESTNIHAFTIGDIDNSDVIIAKETVQFMEETYGITITHHIVSLHETYSNKCKDVLTQLQDTLRTDSVDSLNKALPLHLLCQYIKNNTDVKVLLCGEGLDELCGDNQLVNISDAGQFQRKSVELLRGLHKGGLMVFDRIAANVGLEIRYPFLSRKFVEFVLSIHPRLKMPQVYRVGNPPIEKYIIRKSFEALAAPSLPYSVLWRTMSGLSDCLQLNSFVGQK